MRETEKIIREAFEATMDHTFKATVAGRTYRITPESYYCDRPDKIDEAEFFFVSCEDPEVDERINLDAMDFVGLIHNIENIETEISQYEKSKKNLHIFYEKIKDTPKSSHDWDMFSDWHKDIYGFRPNGDCNMCAA